MKMVFYAFMLLTALAGNTQTAASRESQQTRILALESAWNQAVMQKDSKAVAPLLDEQLIYIDDDGSVMNKARYLTGVQAPEPHLLHIVNQSSEVRFFARSAVVVGIYREQGVRNGKAYVLRDRFVDTWIERNGSWICVASQSTLITH
ncbi:MAG: nuclear transport factor 2 family protein [Candidatus Sulfotelmatobacter sp.]